MLRLRAARVFTGTEFLAPGEVVVEGDRIVSVGPATDAEGLGFERPELEFSASTASEVVDLGDVVVDDGVATAGGYCAVLDAFSECLQGHFDVEHSTVQIEPASHSREHPERAAHA